MQHENRNFNLLDLRSLEEFPEKKEWTESIHWLGLDSWLNA